LRQNKSIKLFEKYDEKKAKEDAVSSLANERQEIFSFDKIEPSLVFFNCDGQSISIISNNNKNDKEYKNLQDLWNSQNCNSSQKNDLIDYKNMKHKQFLEQIKTLFSLDTMDIKDISNICEKLGNYIFVSDNFIKMVRILLNIEAKIPVILMGETGVGKTKLLEMLATLYGKGKCRWKKLQIHAGITDQTIISFIDNVNKEVKEEGVEDELTWIFFDEINTCNSLGLITEIMCNHTYLGKKINKNFIFLGACNPYRILTKKMKESGLLYYNMKEDTKLNNLVYTVNPLPHSLLNFVFDFGSLREKDEEKYITNTIISILSKINPEKMNLKKSEYQKLIVEMIDSIVICHNYIREIFDRSSVSLREIRRFGLLFEYFLTFFKKIVIVIAI
jgi:ABC-type oligopeptide transport system ATPase subunit